MSRLFLFCLLLSSGASAAAQEPAVLLSTSTMAELPGHLVSDQELVHHDPLGGTRPALSPAALAAYFENDGSGLVSLPGDLDAVCQTEFSPADGGLLVSFASDGGGFKDGDVLELRASGAQVLYPETFFVIIAEVEDDNVDIDGFHRAADGTIFFSFNEDEDSSLLSGDQAGVVRDGAILRFVQGDTAASVLYTEDEVSLMVSQALGSNVAIGDVKGLSQGPDGSVVFSVQSPSDHDATLFADKQGGAVITGFEESSLGFLDNEELDAVSFGATSAPALIASDERPAIGEELSFSLYAAEPGTPVLLLGALGIETPWYATQGWGGLVLADDALLSSTLASPALLLTTTDGLGGAEWSLLLPPMLTPQDLFVQAFELGDGVRSTAPLRLEVGQ